MSTLTEKTLVPLGAIYTVGISMIGLVVWLTTIFVTTQTTAKAVENIQIERAESQKNYFDHLIKIESDISEIKSDIKSLNKQRR